MCSFDHLKIICWCKTVAKKSRTIVSRFWGDHALLDIWSFCIFLQNLFELKKVEQKCRSIDCPITKQNVLAQRETTVASNLSNLVCSVISRSVWTAIFASTTHRRGLNFNYKCKFIRLSTGSCNKIYLNDPWCACIASSADFLPTSGYFLWWYLFPSSNVTVNNFWDFICFCSKFQTFLSLLETLCTQNSHLNDKLVRSSLKKCSRLDFNDHKKWQITRTHTAMNHEKARPKIKQFQSQMRQDDEKMCSRLMGRAVWIHEKW